MFEQNRIQVKKPEDTAQLDLFSTPQKQDKHAPLVKDVDPQPVPESEITNRDIPNCHGVELSQSERNDILVGVPPTFVQ